MSFDYLTIAVALVGGILFVYANMWILSLVRPNKPSDLKLSTYECGEEAFSSSWLRFDMRFYTVALIFVVFDLEIAFLFPWAVVYRSLGILAFVEGLIFVGILFLGLFYVWAKGDLDWVKAFAKGRIPEVLDGPPSREVRKGVFESGLSGGPERNGGGEEAGTS